MTRAQIIDIQTQVGTAPDGFWGPKSMAAIQRHLRALMPKPNPWPLTNTAALNRFYGDPGRDEVAGRLVTRSVAGLGLRFAGKEVQRISVHQHCADSLLRILRAIAESEHAALLGTYAGIYNHRPMRGGSRWSLHAYGAAIDLDPARNGLHTHWPTRATMPLAVMEMFAREGWLPAGAFWSRDAMHFQATQ